VLVLSAIKTGYFRLILGSSRKRIFRIYRDQVSLKGIFYVAAASLKISIGVTQHGELKTNPQLALKIFVG